jgi:hypothetical protein
MTKRDETRKEHLLNTAKLVGALFGIGGAIVLLQALRRGRRQTEVVATVPEHGPSIEPVTPEEAQPLFQRKVSLEVREWLNARQRELPVVATTRTSSGQIIDWIPIEAQVPSGIIATPPPPAPLSVSDLFKAPKLELEVELDARGPAGTVPVVRPDPDRIHARGSIEDFLSKYGQAGAANPYRFEGAAPKPLPKPLIGGSVDGKYVGSFQNVTAFGVEAKINIWNPFVQQGFLVNDFSLAQISVTRGSGLTLQTIEAGWQKYPNKYGDSGVHLFVYYTTNGYTQDGQNLGGYNGEVSGWVQISPTVKPGGAALSPTSTAGIANQFEIYLKWQLFQGNWWLWYVSEWIGYYPASLFSASGLKTQASRVIVQGEVADSNIFLTTTTDMGSGKFASAGWGSAAYVRQINYLSTSGGALVKYAPSNIVVTSPNCYSHVGNYNSNDPTWLSHFFFGGPGKNINCP